MFLVFLVLPAIHATPRARFQDATCPCEHCVSDMHNSVADCESLGLDCGCLLDCKCQHCVVAMDNSIADCESLGLDCSCYHATPGSGGGGKGGACADFDDRTQALNDECCDEVTEDCSSGRPAVCNIGCAHVLLPYFDDCGEALGADGVAAFADVVAMCHAAEDSPTCLNGGTAEGTACICIAGYEGSNCENDVDECLSMPCQNGGLCGDSSSDGSNIPVDAFKCNCVGTFSGEYCEEEGPTLPTFAVSSGDCTVTPDGACFRSPNYPDSYGANERCAIEVAGAGFVRSTAFATESCPPGFCDYLYIGEKFYDGDGGELSPIGAGVKVSDGEISWNSDRAVQASGFEVCGLDPGPICAQHGTWDGSVCSCTDNSIGNFCSESCGQHGAASTDGSTCNCDTGFAGNLCQIDLSFPGLSQQYVITGSKKNLDGTYSLVEVDCNANTHIASIVGADCDAGSHTTCGGTAVYQAPNGNVLVRSVSEDGSSRWKVVDALALGNCKGSVAHQQFAYRASKPGQPPGAPDDDDTYGLWMESGSDLGSSFQDSPRMAIGTSTICVQHGNWDGSACTCHDNFIGGFCTESCGEHGTASTDGSTCSCTDNFIGEMCTERCGEHGTASADGSACVCDVGYSDTLCTTTFPQQYVITGSSGTSDGGNLDGTYSRVEADCSEAMVDGGGHGTLDIGNFCDRGSPTTCGGAPVYQRGGAEGLVLYRTGSCIRCGLQPQVGKWKVADNTVLTRCVEESVYAVRELTGQLPGAPDDSAMYGAWQEGPYPLKDTPLMAIVPAGGH